MSENTTVGPAGSNGPALPARKPDNHGTDRRVGGGKDGGSGPDASDLTLNGGSSDVTPHASL